MPTILDALRVGLEMIDHRARRSGRTEQMLIQCRPGHRIICAPHERKHIEMRLHDLRLTGKVELRSVNPERPDWEASSAARACDPKPTVFTHEFINLYWQTVLDRAAARLDGYAENAAGVQHGYPRWPSPPRTTLATVPGASGEIRG